MKLKKAFILMFFVVLFFLAVRSLSALSPDNMEKVGQVSRGMIEEGDYAKALEELIAITAREPDAPELKIATALAKYGLMEYGGSYNDFKSALENGSAANKKFASYAVTNLEKNMDILKNIENAKNALTTQGGDAAHAESIAAGHILVLDRILNEGRYYAPMALAHIFWLKKNMPDMPGLNKLSGDVYYSAMVYHKAVENYERAVLEDRDNAVLARVLGDCYVATGNFEKAQDVYGKAVGIYRKNGLDDTSEEIRGITKISQSLPRKYEDIAELINKGSYAEAEEICKKRISLNGADYAAITQLGEIYWQTGKRKNAIKLFRKVVNMAPEYPTAHLFLGKAYFFERKADKGFAEFAVFKEKMALLPEMDGDTADFYIGSMHYLSYIYSTLKRYDDVMSECRNILKIKPDDQQAHYNMAVCYYVYKHNLPKAYDSLRKVIEIGPDTRLGENAKVYIGYIRRNPDSRVIGDFTFYYEE